MDAFIDAVKSNDLVKAKKAFGPIMLERANALVESRKRELAAQIMIEGEESDEEKDIEDEEAAKKSKDAKVKASKEHDGKEIDAKKPDEEKRTA